MTTARPNLLLALAAFALVVAVPAAVMADGGGVRLEATLTATDLGPDATGRAEFRDQGHGRLRLRVEVEEVDFTNSVKVLINGQSAGTIPLDANGDGELELDTGDGDTVPAVRAGDDIQIVDADTGAVLLAGTFATRR
jgi:hypothetical protein